MKADPQLRQLRADVRALWRALERLNKEHAGLVITPWKQRKRVRR